MSMSTLVRHRKSLAAVPAAGLAVLLLAGCGGGTSAAAANAPATGGDNTGSNTGASGAAGNNGGARTFPGASGQIAAVSGKTLQVQNTTTQTAVKYTDSTKLSQTVAGTQSDLALGKCISVRSTDTGATAGATPAPTPDTTTPVAAASVTISDPVNGTCVGGLGGFPGGFGGGARGNRGQSTNGQAPTGIPNAQAGPGGQGFRGGVGGRGVDGKITKIDGDTVTVEMQQRQFNQNTAAGATPAAPTTTTVSRTVTLSSATTYTKTVSAAASDLKVGKCVTAFGTADSSGAITATSISLRPTENGSCTTAAFGGRRTGAGAGAGAPTTTS